MFGPRRVRASCVARPFVTTELDGSLVVRALQAQEKRSRRFLSQTLSSLVLWMKPRQTRCVMAGQNYQDRGAVKRTQLITIRVAPEERQALHRAAREHGETLSRMLLSPWLACDGMRPQASGRANHVVQTDASKPCEPEAPRAPSPT